MISTIINRMDCIGTGGAGPFPYTFMIYDKIHLKVYVDGLGPKVVDTDYTVSGVNIGTGNVTFLAGHYPILNSNILIIRDVPLKQLVDYINHSPFNMDILEKSLDYLTMISQQFNELVGRVVKVPVTSLLTTLTLPEAVVGGELIRWNAGKTALDLVNVGLADALNVITTQGDLIIGSAGGIAERKGIGTLGKFFKSMGPGANPVWADFSDLNPINLVRNGSFESWLAGTAVAPDNWTLTGAAATVAREVAIFKHGLYSAKVTRAGTDCHLSRNCYVDMGSTYIQSRIFTFGAWVYAAAVDRVRLRVNDGVTTSYSSYHTGGSTWEFLTVTVTAGVAVTAFTVGLAVDTGNTSGYIDGAMLVEGSTPFPFSSDPLRDSVVGLSGLLVDDQHVLDSEVLAVAAAKGANTDITSLLGLTGDVANIAWYDYSATSTIVGWSSFTTKQIYVKKIGKSVLVMFRLVGTSNSTAISFTLPYSIANINLMLPTGFQLDNDVVLVHQGLINADTGSSLISIFKDVNFTAWTASGGKQVVGQFWYESV